MAKLMPPLVTHFDDDNGNPLVGGKVFFYEAGTSTPKDTFTDANSGIPNPNPVVLNARGDASIWLAAGEPYKAIIKRSDDSVVRTVDFITRDAADDAAYAALEAVEAARDVAIEQAGIATAQAVISTSQAAISTAQAVIATTQAGLAATARDGALLSRGVFDSTAKALSNGVLDIVVTASTGADGIYDVVFSAGNAKGKLVKLSGQHKYVPQYSGDSYVTAPTITATGLTGITASVVVGPNADVSEYFSTPFTGAFLQLYRVDAGPVATAVGSPYPSGDTVRSIAFVTQTLGRPDPVIDGAATTSSFTYVYATPATYAGTIKKIRVFGENSGGTLKIKVFDRAGDDFTCVSSQSITIAVGAQTFEAGIGFTAIPVLAGQYIGFYGTNKVSQSSNPSDNGGWYSVASDVGAGSSFNDPTLSFFPTARFELGFEIEQQVLTATDYLATKSSLSALSASVATVNEVIDSFYVEQIVGRTATPADDGHTTSSFTYVLNDPLVRSGKITSITGFGKNSGGALKVKRFTKSGNDFTQVGSSTSLTIPAGVFTLSAPADFTAIDVVEGELLGLYATNKLSYTVNNADGGGYFSAAGDLSSLTDASPTTAAFRLEIGFHIDANVVTGDAIVSLQEDVAALAGGATSKTVVSLDSVPGLIVVGDSYTAGFWSLQSLSYVSIASALSDLRVYNYGRPGDDALGMAQRIRENSDTPFGISPSDMKARYAVIATGANDGAVGYMTATDRSYFQANVERLVDTLMASGVEPILMAEFNATQKDVETFSTVSRERGIRFYDGSYVSAEMGRLDDGFYYNGHPGVRSNGTMWRPLLDIMDSLPRPEQSLKVYRKRAGFSAATEADLLTKDRLDVYTKFREIDVAHRIMDSETAGWDQLDNPAFTFSADYIDVADEYELLRQAGTVASDDYLLIRGVLPGTAKTLSAVSLKIASLTDGATVWVRDYHDATSGLIGKIQGQEPDAVDYLAKWDLPVGAWRALEFTPGEFVDLGDLRTAMKFDTVEVLVYKSGGVTVGAPSFECVGVSGKPALPRLEPARLESTQLLTTQVFDASLTGWTTSGSPASYAPIDPDLMPRDPANTANPLTYAVEITDTKIVQQTVTLPSLTYAQEYELTVWARWNPPAFLDNSVYGFPSGRVVDTDLGNIYPDDSPVVPDTAVIRRLLVEHTDGTSFSANGGSTASGAVGMCWQPVRLRVTRPAYAGTSWTFKLLTEGDTLEVAKVSARAIK